MKETVVSDLRALMQFQETLDQSMFFCFRGQADAGWNLVPSFYRGLAAFDPPVNLEADYQWLSEIERDIYREFDCRGRSFIAKGWEPANQWHQLILGQHFGMPTRLLDWTKSLLIAAYFAVTELLDRDGAIWVLNVSDFPFPPELGRLQKKRGFRPKAIDSCITRADLSFFIPQSKTVVWAGTPPPAPRPSALPSDQSGNPELSGFLVIMEPPLVDDRVKNQQGLLSMFLSYQEEDVVVDLCEYIRGVEAKSSTELLSKVVIPQSSKFRLAGVLEQNGVDPHHVFPDLQGLMLLLRRQRESHFDFYREDRKKWKW